MIQSDLNAIVSATSAADHWKRIPLRPHHGSVVPLFSIYTSASCGIGEYPDLIPLLELSERCGWSVLQLLPLNATGGGASPYSSLSGCALNPIHLGLQSLLDHPHAPLSPDLTSSLKAIVEKGKGINRTQRVDYPTVAELKERFLRLYHSAIFAALRESDTYKAFLASHPWLDSYAQFVTLKAIRGGSWREWPETEPSSEFAQAHRDEIDYHQCVQYLCFEQMCRVKRAADQRGILLKGDLPILVDRESAEVWANRQDFLPNGRAGAPPDYYAPEGQDWGFPLYDWKQIGEEGFALWKQRLQAAEELYHLYRLDHFVGFFRIWSIPDGHSAKEGAYFPADEREWLPQGEMIMRHLLSASKMLPIAEDLGTVPDEVRQMMRQMGICGTKVLRWERRWKGDQGFIPVEEYPLLSLTTVSTHDSSLLRQWWEEEVEEARLLEEAQGWVEQEKLTPQRRKEILQLAHRSRSLFHIDLLQEYLPLCERYATPTESDRINVPGTIAATNWSARLPVAIETLLADEEWIGQVRDLLPTM